MMRCSYRTASVFLASLLCCGLVARAADEPKVDRADPVATAKAVLKAYKAKDLKAIADLSTEANQKFFRDMAEQGEKHPRYKSLFEGWRWEAVSGWTDAAEGPRYRAVKSIVKFAELKGGDLAVVAMRKEGEKWSFDDLQSIEKKAWDEAPTTPK